MNSNPLAADNTPALALSEVVARIGAEVALPLTAALDRVQRMASTGRIDRPSLQALREEIDGARRAGMRGQQIARLAGGHVQQTPERINLATLLRDVLTEQAAQATSGPAVGHRQSLAAVEVVGDPSLIATVLRAAADWSRGHACAPVDWRLELQTRPTQARLTCQLAHQPSDLPPIDDAVARNEPRHLAVLDSLDWLLLRFAAHMAGVAVEREDSPARSQLTLRFSNVVPPGPGGMRGATPEHSIRHARLVAGSQVLVLASRREARQLVREAMQGHDLFVDYVPSVAAAREYCDDAVPQVLIYESAFATEALRTLCQRLDNLVPSVALVEIDPHGRSVEHGSIGDAPVTRIGIDALRQELAPMLVAAITQRR